MFRKLEIQFAGRTLSLETGRLARQAHGSVLAQYGETMVLATVVSAYEARPNIDFLPLTVDYQEKTFAAGKIPGGFFKREGRPSEKEILTSRLIDRSMRPLFPKGYDCEVQLIVTVLSADRDNDPDHSLDNRGFGGAGDFGYSARGAGRGGQDGTYRRQDGRQSDLDRIRGQRTFDRGRGEAGFDRDAGRRRADRR